MAFSNRAVPLDPTHHCLPPFSNGAKHSQQPHSLRRSCMAVLRNRPPRRAAVRMSSGMKRRSGNFQPSSWDCSHIPSLTNNSVVNQYTREHERLKSEIKRLLTVAITPLDKVEVIDALQQFGIKYHFRGEIQKVLDYVFIEAKDELLRVSDLHSTALLFKVLRENGYEVSQDIFKRFLFEKDGFIRFSDVHGYEIEGILSLYEASYLGFEGEEILVMAQEYAFKHLQWQLHSGNLTPRVQEKVRHVLEIPTHWRMTRVQARWYINFNDDATNVNTCILQFAKLDFKLLQIKHQEEIGEITKWWKNLSIIDDLRFARDRVVESYMWAMGIIFEPEYKEGRKYLTQAICLLFIIDDMYDVYGSVEELEIFTAAIERWDINEIEKLPDYMRTCFLALFNMVNDSSYHILKDKKIIVIQHIKKVWEDLCKAYFLEAKWYHDEKIPQLEDYMRNAIKSTGVHLALTYIYIFTSQHVSNEVIDFLQMSPRLINWSANIFRINNDLHTSSNELKRGDVAKIVECYMHEKNISRKDAEKNIENIIVHTWRSINQEQFVVPFQKIIVDGCINICRVSHCFYKNSDGYGSPGKEQVKSLLFESV